MNNSDLKEILDRNDEAFAAYHRAEEQLDYALEMNRSITRALRETRRARKNLAKAIHEGNQAALRMYNK